jgi:hypothetical protein
MPEPERNSNRAAAATATSMNSGFPESFDTDCALLRAGTHCQKAGPRVEKNPGGFKEKGGARIGPRGGPKFGVFRVFLGSSNPELYTSISADIISAERPYRPNLFGVGDG